MKKFLIFVIFATLIFSACVKNDAVEFETGNYYNKNWNETSGTYNKAVVPDENSAVEIATALFNNMENSEYRREYVPQAVFYDEQDEVWIVSFWKESVHTLGGGCSIAIQKEDGRVLRIWFGE